MVASERWTLGRQGRPQPTVAVPLTTGGLNRLEGCQMLRVGQRSCAGGPREPGVESTRRHPEHGAERPHGMHRALRGYPSVAVGDGCTNATHGPVRSPRQGSCRRQTHAARTPASGADSRHLTQGRAQSGRRTDQVWVWWTGGVSWCHCAAMIGPKFRRPRARSEDHGFS
jgi:hypothetical protein